MITIQPPFIFKYFSTKKVFATEDLFSSFYLSWEDALWHLLDTFKIKKGAKILVPDFFCGNVVEHMQEHGLRPIYYKVSNLLITSESDFISCLKKYTPSIVVIFHPVGITNSLLKHPKIWSHLLSPDALLIEDCVHRVIDPSKLKLISSKHFVIDSLRKVVPIQGCNVYSSIPLPRITISQSFSTIIYRLGVMWWWIYMQHYLRLTYYSPNIANSLKYNLLAEKYMIRGYDLIGRSKRVSPGIWIMRYLSRKLPITQIEESKIIQAKKYASAIKKLINTHNFWVPKIGPKDSGLLRGYPLIIHISIADRFLKHMRNGGVLIRFELNDSPWSKKQKIVYLPMGIHLTVADIATTIDLLNKFTN